MQARARLMPPTAKVLHPFTLRVLQTIKALPKGKVATYGLIACLSGNPRGARQVSRILHSCSDRHALPWHRIINAQGGISLTGDGAAIQRALLEAEGIVFTRTGTVDVQCYLWRPESETSES